MATPAVLPERVGAVRITCREPPNRSNFPPSLPITIKPGHPGRRQQPQRNSRTRLHRTIPRSLPEAAGWWVPMYALSRRCECGHWLPSPELALRAGGCSAARFQTL